MGLGLFLEKSLVGRVESYKEDMKRGPVSSPSPRGILGRL